MLKSKKWLYPLYSTLIILIYIALSYNSLVFNDYTWHIKAGEWMVKNKEIMTTNIFSWVTPNEYLFTHEWLAEIFMYLFKYIFKLDFLFMIFCILLLFVPILIFIKKNLETKSLLSTCVLSVILIMISSSTLYARPLYFGLFFFTLLVKTLNDIKTKKDNFLWVIFPIITILWTNMHGGTVLFAILGPLGYLIGSFFKFESSKLKAVKGTIEQRKKYLYLTITNTIATLLNPCGIKMFYFSLIINNSETKEMVQEWNKATIDWYNCSIVIILIITFLIFTKMKIDFTEFAGLTCFVFLTLVYGRFYSWTAIYFIIVFIKYFSNKKSNFFEKGFPLQIVVLTVMIFGYIIFAIFNMKFPEPRYEMSNEMVEAIRKENPKRMFNSYNTGGILAYNDFKVFGISDAEAMDFETMWLSKRIENLDFDLKLLEMYNFDYFLVNTETHLYKYFKLNSDKYELIYKDDEVVGEFNSKQNNQNHFNSYALVKNLEYDENIEYDESNKNIIFTQTEEKNKKE